MAGSAASVDQVVRKDPDSDKAADTSQPSAAPHVTANGQVFWTVRDVIFSPKIRSAAASIKRANEKSKVENE